jgi:nicotinic acid mononucleotide adenylyltransferase
VNQLVNSVIETPMVDISSSDIRSRLAAGKDVNGLVCPAVLGYIRENGLYNVENDPNKGVFD